MTNRRTMFDVTMALLILESDEVISSANLFKAHSLLCSLPYFNATVSTCFFIFRVESIVQPRNVYKT